MRAKEMPSVDFLMDLFKYDKKNGQLIWKSHWHVQTAPRIIGTVAGRENNGYFSVKIKGKLYLVHRIIWFIENQTEPESIDHIDGNKANNKISNLRSSNARKNGQNRHTHRSGRLVGATYRKSAKKWVAQINEGKKKITLGYFSSEVEAHNAYMEAANGR